MKRILAAILIGIALSGCALVQPAAIPVESTLSAPAQAVQKAINETNVLIAASANVVAQNVADGLLTKTEAQNYVAKLKDFAKKADQAQALLAAGDVINAKTQAELLSTLILALHKEIIARKVAQ